MQLSEFRDLLANDGFAATFQTMGQYRTEMLRALDKLRAQADARPVAWRVTGHWKDGAQANPFFYTDEALADMHAEHLASAVIAPLYTHPEESAPGLNEPAFWISKSDADWLERVPNVNGQIQALRLGGASRVPVFLTRASAATVAEPSEECNPSDPCAGCRCKYSQAAQQQAKSSDSLKDSRAAIYDASQKLKGLAGDLPDTWLHGEFVGIAEQIANLCQIPTAQQQAEPTIPMEVLRVTYAPDMTAEEFARMWPKFKAWQQTEHVGHACGDSAEHVGIQQAEPKGTRHD